MVSLTQDGDDVREVSFLLGIVSELVRATSKLVLLGSTDLEGRGEPIGRVAHNLARRKLCNSWQFWSQVFELERCKEAEALAHCLGFIRFEHDGPHSPREADRYVGHEFDTSSNADIVYSRINQADALKMQREMELAI